MPVALNSKSEFRLKDIVIECTAGDVNSPGLSELGLVIMDMEGRQWGLEKFSDTKWKHGGIIEIAPFLDDLIVVAHSNGGDIGHVKFTTGDWDNMHDNSSSGGLRYLKRNFDMEDPDLSLSFHAQISSKGKREAASTSTGGGGGEDLLRVDRLSSVGDQCLQTFETTRDEKYIGRAIEAYREAASCLSMDDPKLGQLLLNIAISYQERYDYFHRTDDLEEAITTLQYAIAISTNGDLLLPMLCGNLGISFLGRFKRSGDLDDISAAITSQQIAVRLCPDGHPKLPILLNHLIYSFLCRFERGGELGDISEAIRFQEHAVQLTPDRHPLLPRHFDNLGMLLLRRFTRSDDLDDISKAISSQQRAVQLTPAEHAHLPLFLNNLGDLFFRRFQCSKNLDDVSEAIRHQQHAIQLVPDGHPDLLRWRVNLGQSLFQRFEQSRDLHDVSEAIRNQRHAVQLIPAGHTDLPYWMNNLGNSLLRRFERGGELEDISQAISNLEQAVQLTPVGHAELPKRLNNLGNCLLRRFERSGDLNDISVAITSHQHAVRLTPEGHEHLPVLLSNLGNSFSRRFGQSGDLDDISEAIRSQQQGIRLTPHGNPHLPARFSNLGTSFLIRFERNDDLDDISEAIRYQKQAVQLTSDGHLDLPIWLSNLGYSRLRRFERSRDLDDIFDSLRDQQRAVQLTPDGHPLLPGRLMNLGNSFLRRFERSGSIDDISEAIKHQQRAVRLTPGGHADLPIWLNNLGMSFWRRFQRSSGNMDDLTEAISNQQQSVRLTPDKHTNLAVWLTNLGNSFALYFKRSGDLEYLEKALLNYRLAATSITGRPFQRLQAAKNWAMFSRRQSSQLLDAHACVIQLLSLVSGFENTVQRRHQSLVDSSQLPTAASAAAFSLGRPDTALEWLVEGRCIVWNQINQLRTPLDDLRAHDQALADRFSAISTELENAASRSELHKASLSMDDKISLEDQAGTHIKLAKERAELLSTIRNIAGFEAFLQPRKCPDIMRTLPDGGAIVIINIHTDRCDALALMAGASEPMHIPLPDFSYQEAERLAKGLHSYLLRLGVISRIGMPLDDNADDSPAEVDLPDVLTVLWSQVVWPILESLAISEHDPDSESCAKLPRIWWCPTGPLAFLPIHAAGDHVRSQGVPNKQRLSDFAVSSYIPTVNLLQTPKLDSVKKHGDSPRGLLIVSQPNTPRKTPIPYAADEAKRIATQLGNGQISYITLNDQTGTVEGVLEAMETFPSIHLACHASQDTTNPLKSSIYLHDGPLELSDIMKKNLPHSDFAFLSACQTSTGDKNLPEEVVHLAAGMLAAGYQSVVGTMWSIFDRHGPDLAEFFYESLLAGEMSDGPPRVDGAGAARALHNATERLREKLSDDSPHSLLAWVPYIHIGV